MQPKLITYNTSGTNAEKSTGRFAEDRVATAR